MWRVGEALKQVYAAREFAPANKQATLQMVHDIEAAMGQDIDTIDWMSPATKARAREKLHAVVDKIGYPDRWRDYSKLAVVRDDAFGKAIRAIEFEGGRVRGVFVVERRLQDAGGQVNVVHARTTVTSALWWDMS